MVTEKPPERPPPGAEGHRPSPADGPEAVHPWRLDLEALEERLETALADASDLGDRDPCVWWCACFLAHGS